MDTLMNACLHLAPHEGTAHDLTHATHAKCPDVQAGHAYRPLHALTCEFHKVVFAHQSRGHQTQPSLSSPATSTHAHRTRNPLSLASCCGCCAAASDCSRPEKVNAGRG